MAFEKRSIPFLETARKQRVLAPPIELEFLVSRCRGNKSMAGALLAELESAGPQYLTAMVRHLAVKDLQAAAETAHALKGAAAILCACSLSAAAAHAEGAWRAGRFGDSKEILREIQIELDRCLAFLFELRLQADSV